MRSRASEELINDGVVCIRCGSRKTPTLKTVRIGSCTVRVRKCRTCGKRFKAVETAERFSPK